MNSVLADKEKQAIASDIGAQLQRARQYAAEGQRSSAEELLRRAASSGNFEAMAALGQHLLATPAASPALIEEGRQLMLNAAHGGNGEAAHFVSLMAGIDPSMADHWVFALAYLGRSAKAGYRPAQIELAFLAGDDGVIDDVKKGRRLSAETWHRLHAAISAAAWLKVPEPRVISAAPAIRVVENFISPRICDWIVGRARPKLEPAQTYDPRDGKGIADMHRTNSEMRFPFPELDLVLMFQLHRIAALTGLPLTGIEPTAVLHYKVGEEFQRHHDYLDPAVPSFAAEVAKTGQRLATILVYLNDDFDGGETDFPLINYRFKGKKGDALIFNNVQPSGAPDVKTLHAGLAPTRGEKWLLSQWIRGRIQH